MSKARALLAELRAVDPPEFVAGDKRPGAVWPACERPKRQARIAPGASTATTGRGGAVGRGSVALDATLALLHEGPLSTAQVAARLGIPDGSAADRLKRLRKLGAVASNSGRWGIRWA